MAETYFKSNLTSLDLHWNKIRVMRANIAIMEQITGSMMGLFLPALDGNLEIYREELRVLEKTLKDWENGNGNLAEDG